MNPYLAVRIMRWAFRSSPFAIRSKTRKYINTLSATNYTNYHELIWMQYAIGAKTNKGMSKSPPGRGIKGVGMSRNIFKVRLSLFARQHVNTLTQFLVCLSALYALVVKCFTLFAIRYSLFARKHGNTSTHYLPRITQITTN